MLQSPLIMQPSTPYKQFTYEGCLPVCLLALSGEDISLDKEVEIITDGLKNGKNFYVLAILEAFSKRYIKKLTIYVHTKFYTDYLRKNLTVSLRNRIDFIYMPIRKNFINQLTSPYILYIDDYKISFQSFSIHAPHFVLVESRTSQFFYVSNPLTGEKIKIKQEKLFKAINSLWKYLKFCPLLIKLV